MKDKKINTILAKLFVVAFLAVLILPTVLTYLLPQLDLSINENRMLQEKPSLKLETITSYPKEFETYYNDNLPFKKVFVKLDGMIKYDLLGVPPKYVIKGEDDWLFYNSKYRGDGDTLADYMGTNLYTSTQLQKVAELLLEKRDYLNSQGIEFYILIAPNKSQIYSEYMPKKYLQAKHSRADELAEYLGQNTDLNIIYPKDELLAMKDKYQTYYKLDTHWNNVGAYVGYRQLMEKIDPDIQIPNIDELEVMRETIKHGDLVGMLGLEGVLEDTKYKVGWKPLSKVSKVEKGENLERYTSNIGNDKKLLAFRDSFFGNVIPYVSSHFEESLYIRDHKFDKELIEKEKPDIVVIEAVERYVDRLVH